MKLRLVQGDALQRLKEIPDQTVNCVMTSPPYWNLRDYGVEGQLGQESKLGTFLVNLCVVFSEVRRVLRDDGICWINMGDTYEDGRLLGVPWELISFLCSEGWFLRSSVIWSKPNPMPEGVRSTAWERCRVRVKDGPRPENKFNADRHDGGRTCSDPWAIWEDCPGCPDCRDTGGYVLKKGSWRPSSSHENLFMLTKGMDYWSDGEAVKEPASSLNRGTFRGGGSYVQGRTFQNSGDWKPDDTGMKKTEAQVRNLRDVWTIPTQPYPESHFATFPEELVKRVLMSSCPRQVCSICQAPWVRVMKSSGDPFGWRAVCSHGGGWVDRTAVKGDYPPPVTGTALDPFMGSGTVGAVAAEIGLNFIGIELNPEYLNQAESRIMTSLDKVSLFHNEVKPRIISGSQSLSEDLKDS